MNTKPNRQDLRKVWGVAVLLVFSLILTSNVNPAFANSASADPAPYNSRQDMLIIAQSYATYRWIGAADNVMHPPFSYYDEVHKGEPGADKYPWLLIPQPDTPATEWPIKWLDANNPIPDTPVTRKMLEGTDEISGTSIDTPNWWIADGTTVNEGIPYAWGGTTTIDAVNLPTSADLGRSFIDKIQSGYPAGDISADNNEKSGTLTNGVDCNGFINNVWRMGARFEMDKMEDMTRPIKFKELRIGDVLMNLVVGDNDSSHVMMFAGFENYFPESGGEPIPGETRFHVYEASGPAEKVRFYTYTLGDLSPIGANDPRGSFRSGHYDSDRIIIQGLTGEYVPRTYLNPVNVMFVIDSSGSINNNALFQARYAAMLLIGRMRPNDRIGTVSFNTQATINYPFTQIGPNGDEKSAAIDRLEYIPTGGGTSIYAGLDAGLEQLMTANGNRPYSPGEAVIILISDGISTDNLDALLTEIKNAKVQVYTLGVGAGVNHALMNYIATTTGGKYRQTSNKIYFTYRESLSIFDDLIMKNNFETGVASTSGSIPPSGTDEKNVQVDSTMGSLTLSIS